VVDPVWTGARLRINAGGGGGFFADAAFGVAPPTGGISS
jgi:hypothetical protein